MEPVTVHFIEWLSLKRAPVEMVVSSSFLGTYEPQASRPENELNLKLDRIDYWKSVGAKATDTANSLVRKARREQDGAVAVKENAVAEINVQAAVEAETDVVTKAPEAVAAESSNSDVATEESAEACSLDSAEASETEVNLAEEQNLRKQQYLLRNLKNLLK